MKRIVYADHAATTPVSPSVLSAMLPFFCEIYGSPSSLYSVGRKAREGVENARNQVAAAINAHSNEIYFTSGGTESDNWAIRGVAAAMAQKGKNHLIFSAFEHPAVLRPAQLLEKQGFSVTFLPVHENGIVRPEELEQAIRPSTGLVSIMSVNNEVGTIQPISRIGQICRENGVLFHTDAVQAIGHLAMDVKEQNIDLLSLSGHKLRGPKGVGALYIRQGTFFPNLMDGGQQERQRRPGTENTAGIVGLGAAIEESVLQREETNRHLEQLGNRLLEGALQIPRVFLNGDRTQRLPATFNLCFEGVEGSSLLLMLDMKGICVSSGSACASGSREVSHTLTAMGLPPERTRSCLRFSLGAENTEEDVAYILQELPAVVERLRQLAPLS